MRTVALALLATLLCLCAGAEEQHDSLVITNVNVIDTRTGTIYYRMTVVVNGDRIRAIAKIGLIQTNKKTHVVNANGKYLIPGLWDMHVHSAGGPAAAWDENVIYPLYVANGVTGIRDMGGEPALLADRRDRIERGQLLGPHIVFAGPFLDGGKPTDPGKNSPQFMLVNTPDEARTAVRALKAKNVDFIKVLDGIPRDAYFAVADEAAREKMLFVGHVPWSVSAVEAANAGQHSIEHLSGILLACSSKEAELRARVLKAFAEQDAKAASTVNAEILATYDPVKAKSVFETFATRNTYQVPTLSWWQAQADLTKPENADHLYLKYVPAWARAEWLAAAKETTAAQADHLKQVAERYIELARAIHRMGVPFMAGTDSPDPFVFPGFSLQDEVILLGRAGFTNIEALQAATFYPALFQSHLDRYGVIEPGHFADMVLLDANPLDDIRNIRRIYAVVLRGRYYSPKDLDAMLAKVETVARGETK
jgi:imidazolonepropionase-like amidohydrolase